MAHTKPIELDDKQRQYLESLTRTRTIQAQVVDRAKALLCKADGMSNGAIAEKLDVNINSVKLWLKKFKEGGIDRALFDDQRSGRPVEITDDAVAWIIDVACQRPADLGYSQELWTLPNLHRHIQSHAVEAGYPRLETIAKSMLQKILDRNDIKPFKIKYYCEKQDPEFETKMHNVLVVYKQIAIRQYTRNLRVKTFRTCSTAVCVLSFGSAGYGPVSPVLLSCERTGANHSLLLDLSLG